MPASQPDPTDADATRTDTTTALPATVDTTRTYIRIQPSDDPIDPDQAIRQCRRLHSLDGPTDQPSLLDRLRGHTTSPPTIEWLLVSDPTTDPGPSLWYAAGIDDDSLVDALERTLRSVFPTTYELTRTTRVPDFQGRLLGGVTDTDSEPTDTDDPDPSLAAVEYRGRAERTRDWMAPFRPYDAVQADTQHRVPLATVAETMAEHPIPIVYQALIRPRPDWRARATDRDHDLRIGHDTPVHQLIAAIVGTPDDPADLGVADRTRREGLDEREAHCSFDVNARAVAIQPEHTDATATAVTTELASAFGDLQRSSWHRIDPATRTGADAHQLFRAIRDRRFTPPDYTRRTNPIPFTPTTSPGIVTDVRELPAVCLLDGAALTAAGARAVAPTPGERTAIPQPPVDQLTNYRDPGLELGYPVRQDRTRTDTPIALDRSLQRQHVGIVGATGAGKSIAIVRALLANHQATRGADILVDPKGGGMVTDYLRAHYATHGHLDNVLYFDCAAVLPALSFFDIRAELAAGIDRTTAVEDRVDHYLEVLRQIMGRDRFEQAVRSPDIIRYLVTAMFDPVNGHDAFSHRDLHTALRTMHERQTAPAVADPDLERMLAGVVANRARTFDEIMQGVANRIEKVPVDRRLARIFNHVPEGPDDPHFDLAQYLDEDVVIIFDTGDLRPEAQRVLTMVLLSNLWTALRRRQRRGGGGPGTGTGTGTGTGHGTGTGTGDGDGNGDSPGPTATATDADADHPLVNLYLEEAASVAASDLLTQFLSQARGFDCSVLLSMQFPGQLRGGHEAVYDEVLNNIGTFVVGTVPADRQLAERLATQAMDARAVATRLRALERGQWLCALPAAFGEPPPRPFVLQSGPLPPGHPEGGQPLSARHQRRFGDRLAALRDRTLETAGLTLASPSTRDAGDDPAAEAEADAEADPGDRIQPRVDTALPHTKRLPEAVAYHGEAHALECTTCGTRHDPTGAGMARAIACCGSLEAVDRDDVPVCDLNLKRTPAQRRDADWSDHQLMFLQAVWKAHRQRFHPLGFDLVWDSMLRLQEYVGVDAAAVQDLVDAGLLRHDTDHPHRLYTVTADGRDAIGEDYREGLDYGHGAGDLGESAAHVFAVEVARRYLEQAAAAAPDSPVTEVVPYYDLDDQHRLDLAGLDDDGDIRVTVEAERVNNDVHRAVPEDFDKMAACEPDEALWVVMRQSEGHAVLTVLNNPPVGEPRVTKTYAETTPPNQFRIDTPGLTGVYTVAHLRDRLD